jgi:hypothetical protein
LAQNSKVCLRFYRKTSACGKKWLKLHISWLWGPYFGPFIYSGPIHKFLWVFKIFKMWLKIQRCYLQFYSKTLVCGKKKNETPYFLDVKGHILNHLDIMALYINFYRFFKISILAQNLKVLAFSFMEKCQFVVKTYWNSLFLGCEAYILDRLYITVLYIYFYSFFKKNQILVENPNVLAFGFTENANLW